MLLVVLNTHSYFTYVVILSGDGKCFLIHHFVIADRGEVPKGSAEIFFRKVKFWKEDGQEEAPPVFVGIILLRNVL